MGVPPLSDPLTAVGVEAPALTANVSHIPGFKPVLRRFPQNRQKLSCEAGGLSRY
ncbi:hypothetical protein ALC56_09337 [Trachymyrmex septentrionalis]|uniref:Uncharacterized protein n=1 Tax=Trachymyrmex septentrionalis TaxID=34720 RepID=A0A195F862_9HYME|nr:hypothetical protein ALC56_09337 [Trachymyrmex septentrionalis]